MRILMLRRTRYPFLFLFRRSSFGTVWMLVLLIITVTFVSCDNSLDPIDRDTGIYAIYGTLDLDRETNYIRVRDLNAPFTEEATREIDAVVTLENLDSGMSQTLKNSVIESEGVIMHNFWVNGVIQPNTEYRLTAKRSDGASVSVTTKTPTQPTPVPIPTNQDCYTPVEVVFEPILESTLVFRIGFSLGGTPPDTVFWRPERVVKITDENTDGKISIQFTPNEELRFVPPAGIRCHDLVRNNFFLRYFHYGPDLYEKIINDPFDILQSTERFGAFYTDTLVIPVDISRVCPPDCL